MGVVSYIDVVESRNIFDESQSRAILEVSNTNMVALVALAKELGLEVSVIGIVAGDEVKINDISLPLKKVRDIYFNTFARTIEQDL